MDDTPDWLIRIKTLSKIRKELWYESRGHCHYCNTLTILAKFKKNKKWHNLATIDHIITRAEGGDDSRNNVVLACYDCNHKRGITDYARFKSIRMDPEKWEIFKSNLKQINRENNFLLHSSKFTNARKAKMEAAAAKCIRNDIIQRQSGKNGIKLLNGWLCKASIETNFQITN